MYPNPNAVFAQRVVPDWSGNSGPLVEFRKEQGRAQSETITDAGELTAVADAVSAKALDKLFAQAANQGSAAGEEDGFDGGRIDGCIPNEGIEFVGDPGGEIGGVGVELREGQSFLQLDARVRKDDRRNLVARKHDFGRFDDLEQGETLILRDEGLEPFKSDWIVREPGQSPDEVELGGVAQKDDLIPLANLPVQGGGHFELFAKVLLGGAPTKEWSEFMPHRGGVIFIAGDRQTAGGENITGAIDETLAARVELHDSED